MNEIRLTRRATIGFYIMAMFAGIGWLAAIAAAFFYLGYV